MRSERDSNPRYRLTRSTAFPGPGSPVQGGAPAGIAYSNSHRKGHSEAGEGTRVGTPLGLVGELRGGRWSATILQMTRRWSAQGSSHSTRVALRLGRQPQRHVRHVQFARRNALRSSAGQSERGVHFTEQNQLTMVDPPAEITTVTGDVGPVFEWA
jgi:hypothetical protein